jgi:hypothetical protein
LIVWKFVTGQATGSAHEKLRVPCQDRFSCIALREHGAFIGAVADGAGSASLADVGAGLAVEAITAISQLGVRAGRHDLDQVLRDGATLARTRILEEAATRGVAGRELACTLLAVIASPAGGAALQIGDGVIVVRDFTEAWRWLFWPQKGEYANATFFLTDESALDEAQVTALPPDVQDIAMLSDGLESLALHFATRTAHAPFFRGAFASVYPSQEQGELVGLSTALSDFLRSPPVRARTDDDVSLVLATRRTGS